jgi:hypothetical protein
MHACTVCFQLILLLRCYCIVSAAVSQVTQTIAHTMKGAAANLMCYGLRDASLALEKTAFEGSKGTYIYSIHLYAHLRAYTRYYGLCSRQQL